MMSFKRLKYQLLLDNYPNCPPKEFMEVKKSAFRWVYENIDNEKNFKPLHLISDPPPKMLDDSDLMCLGYGLSLFDSFEKAYSKYKNLFKSKRNFSKSVGSYIVKIDIQFDDGMASIPNIQGHFTFHEYENTDLRSRIIELFSIFDSDGKFSL
ncbi:MAG: hypothetical protein ACKVOU_11265 [Cytophagales bacterium]